MGNHGEQKLQPARPIHEAATLAQKRTDAAAGRDVVGCVLHGVRDWPAFRERRHADYCAVGEAVICAPPP